MLLHRHQHFMAYIKYHFPSVTDYTVEQKFPPFGSFTLLNLYANFGV